MFSSFVYVSLIRNFFFRIMDTAIVNVDCRTRFSLCFKLLMGLQFCHVVNEFTGTGQLDFNNIIFSDKSHIYSNGFKNKPNFRKWSFEKPREVFDKVLNSPKVTVW